MTQLASLGVTTTLPQPPRAFNPPPLPSSPALFVACLSHPSFAALLRQVSLDRAAEIGLIYGPSSASIVASRATVAERRTVHFSATAIEALKACARQSCPGLAGRVVSTNDVICAQLLRAAALTTPPPPPGLDPTFHLFVPIDVSALRWMRGCGKGSQGRSWCLET